MCFKFVTELHNSHGFCHLLWSFCIDVDVTPWSFYRSFCSINYGNPTVSLAKPKSHLWGFVICLPWARVNTTHRIFMIECFSDANRSGAMKHSCTFETENQSFLVYCLENPSEKFSSLWLEIRDAKTWKTIQLVHFGHFVPKVWHS